MMTAKEILEKNQYLVRVETDSSNMDDPYVRAMIEFAKYHVKEALETAAKKAEIGAYYRANRKGSRYKKWEDGESIALLDTRQMHKVEKKSILESYPLTNII